MREPRPRTAVSEPPGCGPIPSSVGIGLKARHVAEILETRPAVGFFEAHPENYMVAGGPALSQLGAIAGRYPLSLHAVGLSLGSADPVDETHLGRLRNLVERFRPWLVSDHLAWCGDGDRVLPDLFPLPYTRDVLGAVTENVCRVQDALGRAILIENPSAYLGFRDADMGEAAFLGELSDATGCGILLDVNNLYVSAMNVGLDTEAYLARLPKAAIGEIHLAGHKTESGPEGTVRIDDHGSPVADPVWELYRRAIRHFGPVPTLIEWDTAVPAFDVLLGEATKARAMLESVMKTVGNEHAA